MARRTMQATLSLLTIFFFLNILTDNVSTAISIGQKCQCVKEKNSVQRKITDFEVKMPGVLCNKVQIIVHTVRNTFCLRPGSNQGKILQECWPLVISNQKKKKDCLQPKRKRRRKPKRQ